MAYLNIILLLFLFTNFCLFQLTCGCVGKNIGGCNDKDNRCCPGLDCKTKEMAVPYVDLMVVLTMGIRFAISRMMNLQHAVMGEFVLSKQENV